MEIHAVNERYSEKKSKTECLCVATSPSAYKDPNSYSNVDLSNIILGGGILSNRSIVLLYKKH